MYILYAGEYAENEVRKDFTPSERVAITEAIWNALPDRMGRPKKSPVNGPDFPKGESREIAAKRAGFGSGTQFRRSK
jgi:hypothetical protein